MRISEFLIEDNTPSVGYHVIPTSKLKLALKNGIKPDKNGNSYIWDSYDMADWFKDFQNDENKDKTILKINLSGLKLTVDPEAEDMSDWSSNFEPGTAGGAWIVSGGISPDRIATR